MKRTYNLKYSLFFFTLLLVFQIIFTIKKNSYNKKAKFSIDNNNSKRNNILFSPTKLTIKGTQFYKELILTRKDVCNLYIDKDSIDDDIILTILGNSITNFVITPLDKESYLSEDVFPLKKYFYNGYGIILNRKILNPFDSLRIELKLNQSDTELIFIKTRKINKNDQSIYPNEQIDIILKKNGFNEECFSIYESKNDDDYDSKNIIYNMKFLTYTKNIKSDLKRSSRKKYIENNKESMNLIIKNGEYNEICFNLNGDNEKVGSISFELLNLNLTSDEYNENPYNIVIFNEFPLIRGLPSEHYLPKGNAIVYKTEDYKFKEQIALIDIKFHMLQGNSKLFLIECTNKYPYCTFTKKALEENFIDKKYEDINGYISVKKLISENWKDYVAVVYCPEEENNEDCKYEISMKNEDELTYLFKDAMSFSFLNLDSGKFDNENYKINIENSFTPQDNLFINFNLFSGKTTIIFFDSENEEITDYIMDFIGDKKIFIFKNEIMEKHPELYIKIIRNDNAYFSINYELKNKNNLNIYKLEEGISQYGKIKSNSQNNYIIKNEQNLYPLIININTLGNNIKINDVNENVIIKKYSYLNMIQMIFNQKIDEELHSFSITNDEAQEENGNYKMYNILSFNSNTKILMINGQIYTNHLNEKNNQSIYVYAFNKRETIDNKLVINFRKFSKNPVKISINIIKNGNKDYIINRLSKTILINDDEIENTCNYFKEKESTNTCKVFIIVKNADGYEVTEDPLTHIDFNIQIIGNDYPFNPIYLPENILITNLLIPNFPQIYYKDIQKNSSGKIYIDFLEGGGYANAIIRNKNNSEEQEINFNYFNKYFEISNNYTENCDENFCTLFIYLNTSEYMYKYNIYSQLESNNNEDKYFIAPEYEYIYGNLKGEEIHNYITKITKKTKSIIFKVYCDNCQIIIYYNETDFSFNTGIKEEIIIDAQTLGYDVPNFYDNIIKYSIKIENIELSHEQNYVLKIKSQDLKYSNIIPITAKRNEFCEIDKQNPCYFIIPIEKHNKIEDIKFYIANHDQVKIYSKTMNFDLYDKIDEENFTDYLLNDYEINSNNFQANYFEKKINRSNDDNFEILFIIKIEMDYSSQITAISSHYDLMSSTIINLHLNDYTLINLNNIYNSVTLLSYNNNFYNVEVNLIKGNGKINIMGKNLKKNYTLDYKIQENINLLFNSEENEVKEIRAEMDTEDEFVIYIGVFKYNYNNNMVKLNFQKNNYFEYLNINDSNIWPLNFFMKLNVSDNDIKYNDNLDLKNINLNFKFSNIIKKSQDIEDYSQEIFDIKIYLVNIEFIKRKTIYQNEEFLTDNLNCKSFYRTDINSGYALIEIKDIIQNIINASNYLYIIISPAEQFNKKYENLEMMVSSFDLSGNSDLPLNEYLVMNINQNTKLNLGRKQEIFNTSLIEFVLNDNNFNFSFISENNKDFYHNDTNINGENKDFELFGKTIINKIFLDKDKKNIFSKYRIH